VIDLCLSNEQRIGVFPFDVSYERAIEKRIDSRHGVIASSSTGLMQSHERKKERKKERKNNNVSKKRSIKAN
jgi:hypothetical protein